MKPKKKKITTSYITERTHKRLKVYAAKHGRSISDIIEEAVLAYMKKKL